eukprot:PhF_6_TR12898/c0_g1_i6/m.20311
MHVTELGERKFKGIPVPMAVVQVHPKSLSGRHFPEFERPPTPSSPHKAFEMTSIDPADGINPDSFVRSEHPHDVIDSPKDLLKSDDFDSHHNGTINMTTNGMQVSAALEAERPYFAMHGLVISGKMTEERLFGHLSYGLRWVTSILKPIRKSHRKQVIAELAGAWKVQTGHEDRDIVSVLMRAVDGVEANRKVSVFSTKKISSHGSTLSDKDSRMGQPTL